MRMDQISVKQDWTTNQNKLIALRKACINPENRPHTYRYNPKAWMPSGLWYEHLQYLKNSKGAMIAE